MSAALTLMKTAKAAAILIPIILVSLVASPIANANTNNSTTVHPPILWQPMLENAELIEVSEQSLPTPINKNRLVSIQPNASKRVLLPARHWLFIQDESASESKQKAEIKTKQELELIIFDAPNVGRKVKLTSNYPFMAPENHYRVIELRNTHNHKSEITLFAGTQRQHQLLKPLTWNLSTKHTKNVKSLTERDFSDYQLTSDPFVDTRVIPEHYYLIESLFPADQLRNKGRLQKSMWWQGNSSQLPNQKTDASLHQNWRIGIENNAKKYFISDNKNNFIKTQQPLLFRTDNRHDTLRYFPAKNELFRIQALHKNWLFEKNFAQYELPIIQASEQEMAHNISAQQQLINSESKAAKLVINNNNGHQPLPLFYRNRNPFLHYLPLLPTLEKATQFRYSNAPNQTWGATESHSPKLTPAKIITRHPEHQQTRFTVLESGEKTRFDIPNNAAANIINLQLLLNSNPGSKAGINNKTSNQFTLTSDSGEQHSFIVTPNATMPSQIQSAIVIDDWQVFTTSKADVKSSVEVLFEVSPRYVELEVTGNSAVPIKLSYPVATNPKLDESQWLNIFEDKHWANLGWHPQVTQLKNYLTYRHSQFIPLRNHAFWQTLLSQEASPTHSANTSTNAQAITGATNLKIAGKTQELLLFPKLQDLHYWQSLSAALHADGWHRHKITLWQMLMLYHSDAAIQTFAFKQLELNYKSTQNHQALEQLYITRFVRLNDNNAIVPLANILVQQGKSPFALLLLAKAKPLPNSQELLFQTATKLGLIELAKHVSERAELSISTSGHKKPQEQLQKQAQLGAVPASGINTITSQGTVQFHNSELNQQSHWLKATVAEPVTLTNTQPVMLELTVRQWFKEDQWFEDDSFQKKDDWLEIEIQGKAETKNRQLNQNLPLFYSNFRSDNFTLKNNWAGPAHKFHVALPQSSKLVINPTFSDVLINIRELRDINHPVKTTSECFHKDYRVVVKQKIQSLSHDKMALCDSIHYSAMQIQEPTIQDITPATGMQDIQAMGLNVSPVLEQLYRLENHTSNQKEKQETSATHAKLNHMVHQLPPSIFKSKITSRINRHFAWKHIKTPLASSGVALLNTDNTQIYSPIQSRNLTFLKPSQTGGDRLSAQSELTYRFEPTSTMNIRFTLGLDEHIFEQVENAQVLIKGIEETDTLIQLKPGETQTKAATLHPGEHQIAFAMPNAMPNQNVSLITEFKNPQGQWVTWQPERTIAVHQANQQIPIQFHFPEPVWLRIDAFDSEQTITSHYQLVDKGLFEWQAVNATDIGYRFYTLQTKSNTKTNIKGLTASSAATEKNALATSTPSTKFEFTFPTTPSFPESASKGQTWQWGIGYDNRFEQDNDTQQQQNYWEVFAAFNEKSGLAHFYKRTTLSIKEHNDLPTSYHVGMTWLEQRQPFALNWRFDTNFNFQSSHNNTPSAWSMGYRLSTDWDYSINKRFFNRWTLSAAGNVLQTRENPDDYFSGVYSRYKEEHRFGISINDKIRYKPTHDSELYLEGRLQSNDLDDSFSLDQSRWVSGAKVFYQGLVLEGELSHRRYYRDKNRQRATDQNIIGLKLDWMVWKRRENWRLRLNYQHDFHANENAWSLNLVWGNNRGRGVPDYLPSELSFRSLRERQFFNAHNSQETP